jgi:hypothetical protein
MAGRAPQIKGLVWTGQELEKGDPKMAKKAWSASRAAIDTINRAIALREATDEQSLISGSRFVGPDRVEMDTLQDVLSSQIGQLNNAGVMSTPEVERYKAMVGDIGGVSPWTLDRLKSVRDVITRAADARLEAWGYRRAEKETEATEAPEESWFSQVLGGEPTETKAVE